MTATSVLKQRRAGILLHPTSLPNVLGNGDLGPEAYRFVEFLVASGISVWEILPLSPPHDDDSPYNCLSASAGNPLLISLELLAQQGWLAVDVDKDLAALRASDSYAFRRAMLINAHARFAQIATAADKNALAAFIEEQSYWLYDYALYQALRKEQHYSPWISWPAAVRDRQPRALEHARIRLQDSIAQVYFEQFIFFHQWLALKKYANDHGILIFGDMPIFVAHDSADVWANRKYFELDAEGKSLLVSGVPPDYFSPDGQLWGHPQYCWKSIQTDGFRYWIERMKMQLQLADIIRIDHFRGFESYWEIPAGSATAREGRWVKAPGVAMFQALQDSFGQLPMVAEDLGMITAEVTALRRQFNFPGMMILQFAFDGSPENPYVPYKHEPNTVVYTGTHDNDTTLGWLNELSAERKNYLTEYLDAPGESLLWPLIRCAYASVGLWAIVPMQDILELDNDYRMNIPGTTTGNWQWRFSWDQLPLDMPARLRRLAQLYGRC
ncbi:MAG: 4-alpha-glucanotransferase [Gammaproteobacteria bacterium]